MKPMHGYWDWQKARINRRRLLRMGGFGLAGVASAGLLGCTEDDPERGGSGDAGTTSANAKPAADQSRPFVHAETLSSAHFNPVKNYTEGYAISGTHVYDRPITNRGLDSRRFQLEAAASIELTEPNKLVFRLKPGMKFQDTAPVNGRSVSSADIAATQAYVLSEPAAENSGFQRRSVARVETPDDLTVIYHLNAPNAYLFATTQMCNPTGQMIIPREMLDGLDTTPPVGSGAYQFVSAQVGTRYVFKKNPTYRDADKGLPYIENREVLILGDPIAQETAVRGGGLSEMITGAWPTIEGIKNSMGERAQTMPRLLVSLQGMNMNQEKAPWNDVRVREAFYRFVNRQQFLDLAFDGKGVVPPGPLHASLETYQLNTKDTEKYFRNDMTAARQLLSAANWDFDKAQEFIMFPSPTTDSVANIATQQAAGAGIKLRAVVVPFAEILPTRIGPGNFDIYFGGQPGGDTPYRAMRNQHSDTLDVFNHVGLQNKAIDALVERSERETDFETQVKLVKEIQLEALKLYTGNIVTLTEQRLYLADGRLANWDPDVLRGQEFRQDMYWTA